MNGSINFGGTNMEVEDMDTEETSTEVSENKGASPSKLADCGNHDLRPEAAVDTNGGGGGGGKELVPPV